MANGNKNSKFVPKAVSFIANGNKNSKFVPRAVSFIANGNKNAEFAPEGVWLQGGVERGWAIMPTVSVQP